MNRALVVRACALYVPLVAALCVWVATPRSPRERAAALLATFWNIPMLLALHVLAGHFGWWRYEANGATLAGFPIDVLVGWAIAWGALPFLLSGRVGLSGVIALAASIDLIAMPALAPVVQLGDRWIIGEAIALVLCLAPAQALARWTRDDTNVRRRAALQAIAFTGLVLGVLPAAIIEWSDGAWSRLVSQPAGMTGSLLQLIALAGVPGLSAVQEFAMRGRGTPVPFDPPRRLVTSGMYAYVRNPMQCSAALVLAGWGALLGSWWIVGAGVMAVVYGAGFAAGDEARDLERRHGVAWTVYGRHVRNWLPRWRPFHPTDVAESESGSTHNAPNAATLYLAATCGRCSQIQRWIEHRQPIGLTIVAAELHPVRALTRITYEPGDGSGAETGVAALGRALEHIHLGWALVGCFVRLPGIRWFLQLVTDASGGGPMLVNRSCDSGGAPIRWA